MSFLERLVNKVICKGDNIEFVDSGIEWVGPIPATWSIFPACGVFCEVKEKNTNGEYNNPFSFRYGEIVNKNIAGEIDESVEETLSTYRVVVPDTIMINGLNLNYDFISQRVAIVRDKGIITSAYLAVQPDKNKVVPRFVLYLLKAYDYRQVFHGLGSGIRKTLKYQDFKKIKIVAPSLAEQEAIVSYLDFQCEQIDCIISDAKASIEEYKSWKASIIYETVTKGLDPNVEMKDSGVEWIGKMPTHWLLSRVKNETKNLDYLREPISAENRDNKLGLYDYYGASGVIDKIDDYNVDDTVLLIGEDGANLHMRNLPLVYRASGKFWVNNHAHILKVNEQNNYSYMAYLLEAGDYTTYITGAAQPKLSQFNLMRFPIPIAPRPEQDAIEEYLNKKAEEIESLIEEKESLIADLEAYKKSLIFEVVTGKRRVV